VGLLKKKCLFVLVLTVAMVLWTIPITAEESFEFDESADLFGWGDGSFIISSSEKPDWLYDTPLPYDDEPAFTAASSDEFSPSNLNLRTRMVVQGTATDFGRADFTPNTWESEYFQFIWGGPGSNSTGTGTQHTQVTTAFLERNGRALDAAWRVLIDDYGWTPPTRSRTAGNNTGNDYKVNVVIQNTGIRGHDNDNNGWGAYAGIDSRGWPFVMLVPAAMQGYSPVAVHEFGHCVVFAAGWVRNDPTGPWHEAIANYMTEMTIQSPRWPGTQSMSGDFRRYLWNTALQKASPRAYYQPWTFPLYLSINPDNITGLGSGFTNSIVSRANNHEPFFNTMSRILADDAIFKEVIGSYARRMATYNLGNGAHAAYWNDVQTHVGANTWNWWRVYTAMEPAGRANTFQVPAALAPQASGYNIIPITLPAAGQNISVTLNGLTDRGGADWRFAIVIRTSNGLSHFSNLASPSQTASITVPANAQQAFVTVAATPSISGYHSVGFPNNNGAGDHRETAISFNQKNRFPYEITLTNTSLRARPNPTVAGRQHANGGGFVANTATVSAAAFVGPNAVVLGTAQVLDNARIDGHATIAERARISGNAIVSGSAVVNGNARVSGNARVMGAAHLYGNFEISDNAIAKGLTEGYGTFSVTGQGITDGDFYNAEGITFNRGTIAGVRPQGNGVNWGTFTAGRPFVDGMNFGYDFAVSASDPVTNRVLRDRHHSTYAVSHGQREANRTSAGGVLTLNGVDQFALLNHGIASFRDIEIQTAVLWRGGAQNQRVFHFGDSTNHMFFTPSNADNRAEFVIRQGSTTQRLTANAPIPIGVWTIVTVRIIGNTGTLTFNTGPSSLGAADIPAVTNTAMTLSPADIANRYATANVYALGRCNVGNFFNGSYDYFNVFFQAAPAPAYTYTQTESQTPPVGVTSVSAGGTAVIDADSVSRTRTITVTGAGLTTGNVQVRATASATATIHQTAVTVGTPVINAQGTSATVVLTFPAAGSNAVTYFIRARTTSPDTAWATAPITVTVSAAAPTFGISLSQTGTFVFPPARVGYGEQTPLGITVQNTGNQPTGALRVALSGILADSFTLSRTSIESIAPDASQMFTLRPNTGLLEGIYTSTVTVLPEPFITTTAQHTSAAITTSGTASWENHNQVNNAALPSSSNPGTGNGWGTWGQTGSTGGSLTTQATLRYEWTQPVSMNRAGIYWYDDNAGTRIPNAATWAIEHSNNGTDWQGVELTGSTNYNNGRALNTLNSFTFNEINARFIRIRIWGITANAAGTGVLRFHVFNDAESYNFAPQSFGVIFTVNQAETGTVIYDMQTTERHPAAGFDVFAGAGGLPSGQQSAFAPLGRSGGTNTAYTVNGRTVSVTDRGGVGQALRILIGSHANDANGLGTANMPVEEGYSYRISYTASFGAGFQQPRIRIEGGTGTGRVAPGSVFDGINLSPLAGIPVIHSITLTADEILSMGNAQLSLSAVDSSTDITWHDVRITRIPSQNITVTFNLNGGTRTGGGQLIQTVGKLDERIMPVVEREGFIFDGWSTAFIEGATEITHTAQWLRLGAITTEGTGNVTSADLTWLARHVAGHTGFDIPNRRIANLLGEDRELNLNDVTMLARWLIGYDLAYLISQEN
jgi:hypothetical protein